MTVSVQGQMINGRCASHEAHFQPWCATDGKGGWLGVVPRPSSLGTMIRSTLFVTPGCHCGRCIQLREPGLYMLAEAMNAIACAVMMAELVPHLCWGLKR